MKINSILLAITAFSSASALADAPKIWITTDAQAAQHFKLQQNIKGQAFKLLPGGPANIAIMHMDAAQDTELSGFMHDNYHRCGGFVRHDSQLEAEAYLAQLSHAAANQLVATYTIDNAAKVNAMIATIDTQSLENTVNSLTAYHNRYYTQQTGIDAANWVKSRWSQIASSRTDISVTEYAHSWGQPSVIATIQGAEKASEIVIIGGHLDSINQSSPTTGRAPGADDNASGISVLTEALQAIVDTNYKPQRTIQIIGYAAEEVGLRGSKAIAEAYKAAGKQVVGVTQFDMTGRHGTATQDIVMMTDYTNAAQNQFLQQLIETYLPSVTYGYDQCGYGCSDHASWYQQGYPASMPFESRMGDINRSIHTTNDTSYDSSHAAKFAKLAVAFVAEMGKNAGDVPPPIDNTLENGVPVTGLTANAKEQLVYTLEVPAGVTNLQFNTNGGSGDADLYVKFGQPPTLQSYDCKSTNSNSTEQCAIGSVQAGTYYVMVEAWNSIQNVTLVGQYQAGNPDTPTPINQTENNLSVAKNSWLKRQVQLGAGYQSLTVTISGGTGDADLYVKQGSDVTTSNYDCRPYKNGNAETCTFTAPAAGTWYIGLQGYQAASGVTLSIQAQ
ncbi:M28 family metallopeptidase [Pseudoalteromonas fenneropenaei]|uniref:M28 family metallopeptidase n=1 Tax=Pseudoalteromonas fenneropenaei TaxID=1737459 RepID=A0ABV7CHH3_9GAMM